MPQDTSDEARIRRRIDALIDAIRTMDIEAVMPIYAPNIVSFDVEPPLQHVGREAKRRNWRRVFSIYHPPLDYEIRDLELTVGDGVAFGHGLIRSKGTLMNGKAIESWLRATLCFQKIAGEWLITHDQVSAPLDFESGRALLNLEP